MTPVEIADYAAKAQDALKVEIIGMLRGSDEFGTVFEKLDGWRCIVRHIGSEWVPLNVMWSRYTDDDQECVTLIVEIGNPVWALVEKTDPGGFAGYVRCGGRARWYDIAAAADVAVAEFDKLKERANV